MPKLCVPYPASSLFPHLFMIQRYTRTPLSILNFLFDFIQLLLVVRFTLKVFGANAGNGFVSMAYDLTSPFVRPFAGIFANTTLPFGTLEWASVVAMFFYGFLAFLFLRILFVIEDAMEEDLSAHTHEHS